MINDTPRLKPGMVIGGKYKILNLIGKGGMSYVHLAVNESVNKYWAVKECRNGRIDKNGQTSESALMTEARILMNITQHNDQIPSIVDIYQPGEESDVLIIVMDLIEGVSLAHFLKENKKATEEQTVKWGIQLCDILGFLHEQNPPVVYRDMKPSNVMLKPDNERVVLIDFGISHTIDSDMSGDTNVLGTQGYASPEQASHHEHSDARSDVYSLGATLIHLVTGMNPTKTTCLDKGIREFDPNLSIGLERVLKKCVERKPEDRYQSMKELKYALAHYQEQDYDYYKRMKIKIAGFAVCFFLSITSLIAGIGFRVYGNRLTEQTYTSYIADAVLAQNLDERLRSYEKAIQLEPSNPESYRAIINQFMDDGVLTSEEDVYLRELFKTPASNGKTYDDLFAENEAEYSQFAYDVAMDYWYYYGSIEEGKIINTREYQVAGRWFKKVSLYNKNNKECIKEYNNAQVYSKMGSYYSSLGMTNLAGDSDISYTTYYNDLISLFDMEDSNSITRLYLEKEILYQIIEHSNTYRDEGINKEDVLKVITSIEKESSTLTNTSSNDKLFNQLHGDVMASLSLAEKSVTSAYSSNKVKERER